MHNKSAVRILADMQNKVKTQAERKALEQAIYSINALEKYQEGIANIKQIITDSKEKMVGLGFNPYQE